MPAGKSALAASRELYIPHRAWLSLARPPIACPPGAGTCDPTAVVPMLLRDGAALWTVGLRLWQILAGAGTILAIGCWLTPIEQGYYYTFASVLGLTVVFEGGLGMVLAQFASHERAHLQFEASGAQGGLRLVGDQAARRRLADLLRHARRWYAVAALAFTGVALLLGPVLFAHQRTPVRWGGPWLGAVVGTALLLALTPYLTISEGCGRIAAMARVRLAQSLLGAAGLWCGLSWGWGLRAVPLAAILAGVVGLAWLATPGAAFLRELLRAPRSETLAWWRDVWPMQWRMAVSWICGYVIFQIYTPLVFRHLGPVPAGQIGMSLQIGQAIGSVGTAWVVAQVPQFGRSIALRDWAGLDQRFRTAALISIGGTVLMAVIVFLGAMLARHELPRAAGRLLPTVPLALVLGTAILNTVTVCLATYLRAHKQEPFLLTTLIGAAAMLAVALLSLHLPMIATLTIGSFATTAVVGVGYGWIIFERCRRDWHAVLPEPAETLPA